MAEVKFCENNFGYGTEDLVSRIENELTGVTVEVEPCLGNCGECAEGPFASVNNEFVHGDTPEELFERIKEELK